MSDIELVCVVSVSSSMMRFTSTVVSVSSSEYKFCSVFDALLANYSSSEVKLSSEKLSEVKEFLEKTST